MARKVIFHLDNVIVRLHKVQTSSYNRDGEKKSVDNKLIIIDGVDKVEIVGR